MTLGTDAGGPGGRRRCLLGPLAVIDCSDSIAGQYCTRLLADYGADVILLEPPAGCTVRRTPPFRPGTDESLLFTHLNAGKRSVRGAAGGLGRLAATADVVVVGQGGDGLTLSRAHARLVVASVTEFGRDGPLAGWRGSEMIYQALSSVMLNNGRQGLPPLYGCGHRASYAAGLAAYAGVLAALFERGASGLGQHVDVCVAEVAASMTTGPTAYGYSGRAGDRRGQGQSLVDCRGEWVLIWIYPFQWAAFCDALDLGCLRDDPRFATADARQANWGALLSIVQDRFGGRPADELVERLQARRLITAKASSLDGLLTHDAHLAARGFWDGGADGTVLPAPFVFATA